MSAVIQALDAEIEQVETDVRQNPDPRLQKLEHLRKVRKFYLDANVVASTMSLGVVELPQPVHSGESLVTVVRRLFPNVPKHSGRRPSPERVRALAAAQEYLRGATDPVKTSTILNHLTGIGIVVPGEVPINNLSAMLSNDPRFLSNGRSGWTLINREAAE